MYQYTFVHLYRHFIITYYIDIYPYKIVFDNKQEYFGLRVYAAEKGSSKIITVALSEQESIHMKKGEELYVSHDPKSYVKELYVYGLDQSKDYRFIVIDTSSESELFEMLGKSKVGEVK